MTIKNNDLVVATQGRAFWVIDDLTLVQQWKPEIVGRKLHVFDVNPSYRMGGGRFRNFGAPRNVGTNPAKGPVINFYAADVTDSTKGSIAIYDKNNKLIREYSTSSKENKLELAKGMNQFNWDLRYPEAEKAEGMILWNGVPAPLVASPGNYSAKLKVGSDSATVPFTILADPNYKISQQDYDAQFTFLQQVQEKYNEVQRGVKDCRQLRTQINDFTTRQKDCPKEVKQLADSIVKQLTAIEEKLHQTKAKSGQDVLNYPIRLNDKLSGLYNTANSGVTAPSRQSREVYAELSKQADAELSKLMHIRNSDIQQLNQLIRDKSLPVIGLSK
jgi:hypothetical protein